MKILKPTIAVLVFALVVAAITWALASAEGGTSVSAPEKITSSSRCPVAGCTASSCHGADPAPSVAEGDTTMRCPKVGCEAQSCHAADRLTSHYHTPKNASLNVWILGLSIFTIAMISIAAYVK